MTSKVLMTNALLRRNFLSMDQYFYTFWSNCQGFNWKFHSLSQQNIISFNYSIISRWFFYLKTFIHFTVSTFKSYYFFAIKTIFRIFSNETSVQSAFHCSQKFGVFLHSLRESFLLWKIITMQKIIWKRM